MLVISVLVSVTACVSAPEDESTTELSSNAAESYKLPAITEAERSLIIRYYYINIWTRLCASVQDDEEGFDPKVSPDAQYYLESEDSEPVLWSDELAILAVGETNKVIALYNDAVLNKNFDLTDSDKESVSQTVTMAKTTADGKGMSLEDYLASSFGYGFTPAFFEKMLTIETVNYSFVSYIQNAFTIDRSRTNNDYEECSELAVGDYEEYYKELLSMNTAKVFVGDIYCSDGQAAAMECIKDMIAADIN